MFDADKITLENWPELKPCATKLTLLHAVQMQEPFSVHMNGELLCGDAGDYLILRSDGERCPCKCEKFEEQFDFVQLEEVEGDVVNFNDLLKNLDHHETTELEIQNRCAATIKMSIEALLTIGAMQSGIENMKKFVETRLNDDLFWQDLKSSLNLAESFITNSQNKTVQ
jgi:hypothetical protein